MGGLFVTVVGGILVNYLSHNFMVRYPSLRAEEFTDQCPAEASGRRDWRSIFIIGVLSGLAWSIGGSVWWCLDSEAGPVVALLIGGTLQAVVLRRAVSRLTWAKILLSGVCWSIAGVVGGMFGMMLVIIAGISISNNMMDADRFVEYFIRNFMWGSALLSGGAIQIILIRKHIIKASGSVLCLALAGWASAGAIHGFLDIGLGLSISGQISGSAAHFEKAVGGSLSQGARQFSVRQRLAISLIPGTFFVGLIGAGVMVAVLMPRFSTAGFDVNASSQDQSPITSELIPDSQADT